MRREPLDTRHDLSERGPCQVAFGELQDEVPGIRMRRPLSRAVAAGDFLWFMSSDSFRVLPQQLPRHRRQVVRLVIRHLAFPQDENDLPPLRAHRPERLAMRVARARSSAYCARPHSLERSARKAP